MKKILTDIAFQGFLILFMILVATFYHRTNRKLTDRLDMVENRYDSLMVEKARQDSILDESIILTLDLIDKMQNLHDKHPDIHNKLFSETD